MWKNTEREVVGWKLLITETFEDYLGVAAKLSGDSVIIMNEVVLTMSVQLGWNRE